jgi:hypothetical protein
MHRFSEGKHSTSFIHGTEDIKSQRHKAVPQVTLGRNLISTNQWWQIEQQISHTQISDILIIILYMNFLPSIYWIATLNKTRSHLTLDTLVHSNYFNSVNDRFQFKECSACLNTGYTQWEWNSLEYENVWERAKKLIFEETTNIHRHKDKQIYRHTQEPCLYLRHVECHLQ